MIRSTKARKQRKYLFNAPLHVKRKWLAAHLEESLLLKYDRRSVPIIKGDTVKVMRGSFRGHENKISHVNVKDQYVEIEGVTLVKADGKKIAKPIHPSKVLITKLNLTDKWRRETLEKELSEEAKKEIEKEAKEQMEQLKEDQRKAEAEKKAAEEEARRAEEAEKAVAEPQPEPKPEAAPEKTEEQPKPDEKTEEPAVEEHHKPPEKKPQTKKQPKKKTEAEP